VIDLTSIVVGPICTRSLADQGADVIKVEAPGGDLLRNLAQGSRNAGMSCKFINFNRNKRSICLDFKQAEGREAMDRLLASADVFVSNVRPAALQRAGLDYDTLSGVHPRLIHCGIVAFGSGGRYYNRPAYDPIIQSLAGVASTLERATGEPRFVPMVMSDHVSGLIATGKGEAIEVPMLENMASFVASEHLGATTFEPAIGPSGDGRLLSEHYRPLPTLDGFITVGPNTNAQAFAFFEAIDRPELCTDPRFDNAAARTENAEAYFEVRASGLLGKTTREWLEIFERIDVPAAAYNRIDDLMDDPHLSDVGMFTLEEHPSEGAVWRTRVANTFSGGMREEGRHAPRLGEHSRVIIEELGYTPTELEQMERSGAVRTA
jgi:crotonobetainyl-CoA:carnitine CoA-transferase CaiB-like acyl-CoA transferase